MNTTELITMLTDPDRSVRGRAAIELGSRREPAAADALVARLGAEADAWVLENLTWAVVQHGSAVLPAVVALLSSDNPQERRQAAHVLSKVGDPAHAADLHVVVADPDADVAVKAYRAAANTGNPDVVPSLAKRLGDGDQAQRDALTRAFETLGEIGVPALVAALSDGDAEVREHAAETLGHIGGAAGAAVDALTGAVADPEPAVRLAAVMALGAVGETPGEHVAALVDADDPQVSATARRLVAAG